MPTLPVGLLFIIAVMARVILIHWKAGEAGSRLSRIRDAGFEAELLVPKGGPDLAAAGANPPDAFVIDLSRLPSQGRDAAVFLRGRKGTRYVPIVFVDGEPEKVAATRRLLPDATYTEWDHIAAALTAALAKPPARPASPGTMAAYAGKPLTTKLGLKPGISVLLAGAPGGFEETLGADVRIVRRGSADLVLLFAQSQAELEARFATASRAADAVWIIWPKKASKARTDLNQTTVRAFGLNLGWVDYKICSIDAAWSGLKFTRRRARTQSASR